MIDRRQESYKIRTEAAEMARSRNHAAQKANGDEQKYAGERYFMSFTKGLPHHPGTGLLQDPSDFVKFRRAIDEGFIDSFTKEVRHGAKYSVNAAGGVTAVATPPNDFRQWEAPTAGTAYELQGPDCHAVTMAPAPQLIDAKGEPNSELVFEMAEVYELAVLRDVHFSNFETVAGGGAVVQSIARLNTLDYAAQGFKGRPRKTGATGLLDGQTAFRGSSPGVEVGPYVSQFMLIGNPDFMSGAVTDGKIAYGSIQIDQRVPVAVQTDYMQTMADYVSVQCGIKPPPENYEVGTITQTFTDANGVVSTTGPVNAIKRRFIRTPRDFATYVHYDALYEAYLNAGLILLSMKTPFDPAFDHLSGVGAGSGSGLTRSNAGGFALFGGPHILTLVTEVATRALKAVRFQKYNNHIRLRPEALAARIELSRRFSSPSGNVPAALLANMTNFANKLNANGGGAFSTLGCIAAMNQQPGNLNSYFLPMAFPEGSPMHPSYGAGHATVAGACVTILKAFFDTSAVLAQDALGKQAFKRLESGDIPVAYRASPNGATLQSATLPDGKFLTLEGELNKLAANISIARNMAGVHYFSDYYDSLRMGEEVAIGILEEQALTYSTDPFVFSVPTFDGGVHRIGRR